MVYDHKIKTMSEVSDSEATFYDVTEQLLSKSFSSTKCKIGIKCVNKSNLQSKSK